MRNYSIGFRMKFDNIKPEDIEKTIIEYTKKFDRYEIKVTEYTISSGKILSLLEKSENVASTKYSLHLPKDILFNTQSYVFTKEWIELLKNYKSTSKIHLITHIPSFGYHKYLKYIFDISINLPQNYILLLENEKQDRHNLEYLTMINELCASLCKEKIENIGICLDFGHLLFGFYKENLSSEYCLDFLSKMSYLLSMTKHIHIHDYNDSTDHLQLGDGIMDLSAISKFIICSNLYVPIIIEVTIKHPEDDGINQVNLLNQALKIAKEVI